MFSNPCLRLRNPHLCTSIYPLRGGHFTHLVSNSHRLLYQNAASLLKELLQCISGRCHFFLNLNRKKCFTFDCRYICTGIFNTVESSFGSCYNPDGTLLRPPTPRPFNRRSCRSAKGYWLGFDISGHCFLLTMANLWILEELRVMRSWNVLGALLGVSTHADDLDSHMEAKKQAPKLPNVSPETVQAMRSAYTRLTLNLRMVFCITACISLLWDFMLFTTIVYFHSMPSKLLGASIGISCWLVCYRGIFPNLPVGGFAGLLSGMPGDGPVHFVAKR